MPVDEQDVDVGCFPPCRIVIRFTGKFLLKEGSIPSSPPAEQASYLCTCRWIILMYTIVERTGVPVDRGCIYKDGSNGRFQEKYCKFYSDMVSNEKTQRHVRFSRIIPSSKKRKCVLSTKNHNKHPSNPRYAGKMPNQSVFLVDNTESLRG